MNKPVLAFLLTAAFCLAIPGMSIVQVYAQACPAWPAACPEKDYAHADLAGDSTERILNPLVPQEISMEYRWRRLTEDLVRRIAEKEHWEDPVELSEYGSSGYRTPDGAVLDYSLRPPHVFSISWQIIVNTDSLQKWGDWLKAFSERRTAATLRQMNNIASRQGEIQGYMDSANYYGGLKASYMSAHFAGYQQALAGGNKAGIVSYEKAVAVYDKKIDVFTNKAAAAQKEPGAEKAQDGFEDEKKSVGIAFQGSVVLTVEFNINLDKDGVVDCRPLAGMGGNGGMGGAAGRAAGPGGVQLLRWFSNPDPDPLDNVHAYKHSRNIALVLVEGWDLRPDSYGYYPSSYKADKQNTGRGNVKKIKCDQARSLSIICSGNRTAMQKFLADLPAGELGTEIAK